MKCPLLAYVAYIFNTAGWLWIFFRVETVSEIMFHSQEQIILMLSQEWGKLIHELSAANKNANATAVRTNRGPPAEDILLGDLMESAISPTFPK